MQPINYGIDINKGAVEGPLAAAFAPTMGQRGAPQGAGAPQAGASPLAQAASGSMGLFRKPDPLRQQTQEAAQLQQQQSAEEALAAKKAALQEAIKLNSTAGFSKLFASYPEMATAYKQHFEQIDKQEQASLLSSGASAWAAVKNGEVPTAVLHLRDTAEAYKASGRDVLADQINQMADQMEAHPESAAFALGGFLVANGGKDVVEGMQKVEQGAAALKKVEADAAKADADAAKAATDADIAAETGLDQALATLNYTKEQAESLKARAKYDAGMLGVAWAELARKNAEDRAKLANDLPAAIGKEVSDDVAAANTNEAMSTILTSLASDMKAARQKAGPVGTFVNTGLTGRAAEAANSVMLTEGAFTEVRKRYKEIREKAISAELKGQGQTTEAERAAYRDGWLEDGRDPADLARDLERRAKVLQTEAAARRGLSEYRAINKSNGNAKEAFTTSDGFEVTPGMSQATFAKEYVGFIKGKAAAAKQAPSAEDAEAARLGGKPVP